MPSCTLKVELANVDTLNVLVSTLPDLVLVFLFHRCRVHHIIERPRLLCLSACHLLWIFVHSGNFLFHGSQEALRIEETSQPEGIRSVCPQPLIQLFVPFDQIIEPFGKGRNDPRNLCSGRIVHPSIRHTSIEDSVDGV